MGTVLRWAASVTGQAQQVEELDGQCPVTGELNGWLPFTWELDGQSELDGQCV